MSSSESDNDDEFHVERSFIDRFRHKYPGLVETFSYFRQNPLSGNTLRRLLGREKASNDRSEVVPSLSPPTMWQKNAPVVISHYTDYASDRLPAYWNSVVPDLREQYGSVIRYEHHDVPPLRTTSESYNIATVGRALQHQAGDEAFWLWFNTVMLEGVDGVNESVEIIRDFDINESVDFSYLQEAVDNSLYHDVIQNDVNTVFQSVGGAAFNDLQATYDARDPVFVLLVNGRVVSPSYNAIVGVVEDVLASRDISVDDGSGSVEEWDE